MCRQLLHKDSFIPQGLLKLLISGEPQARQLFGIIYDDFKGKRPTQAARGLKIQRGNLSLVRSSDQWIVVSFSHLIKMSMRFFKKTCGKIPFIACFMFFILLIFSYASVPPSWLFLLCVHDQGKYLDFKFISNHKTTAHVDISVY